MARREGSPGYRTPPSIDLLECRFLLTSLHYSDASARAPSTLAAEIARQAKTTIVIVHPVASVPHADESPDDEEGDAGVVAGSRGVYVALRPTSPDPNLPLLTGPNQAAAALVETNAGHLALQVASSDIPHLAPAKGNTPSGPVGPGDDFNRGMIVALNSPRSMLPPRISAESLGRIGVLVPAHPGPDDEASPSSSPRRSDLLSDFLPFDRGSLESAFDRFFDQLDDLDDGGPGSDDPSRAIPDSLVLAAAAGVLELGRRYWRRAHGGDEGDDAGWGETPEGSEGGGDDGVGFPDRPGSWPPRLL